MNDTKEIARRASRFGEGNADSLSAYSSASDGDDDGEQNGSRKRRRPMNVTYVHHNDRADVHRLMSPLDSCEACKQRKVKCGRFAILEFVELAIEISD